MDDFDILITGLWKACAIALLSSACGVFVGLALAIWITLAHIAAPMVLP
jgi:hypothetical protein